MIHGKGLRSVPRCCMQTHLTPSMQTWSVASTSSAIWWRGCQLRQERQPLSRSRSPSQQRWVFRILQQPYASAEWQKAACKGLGSLKWACVRRVRASPFMSQPRLTICICGKAGRQPSGGPAAGAVGAVQCAARPAAAVQRAAGAAAVSVHDAIACIIDHDCD
jgi:hypothetical protein